MSHYFIDRFATLDSPLHGLDARTKIIGFAALIVTVLCIPAGNSTFLIAIFFVTAVLTGISQIPLGYVVGKTLFILPFALVGAAAAAWSEGFAASRFLIFVMRSVLCVLLLILLINTTPFSELLRALRKLGCPKTLALNLGFLYRYFFVLTEEVVRMRRARDCRRPGRSPVLEDLKVFDWIQAVLVRRTFERVQGMHQAMLSRGYSGQFAVLAPRRFTWRDLIFLSGVALLVVLSFGFAS